MAKVLRLFSVLLVVSLSVLNAKGQTVYEREVTYNDMTASFPIPPLSIVDPAMETASPYVRNTMLSNKIYLQFAIENYIEEGDFKISLPYTLHFKNAAGTVISTSINGTIELSELLENIFTTPIQLQIFDIMDKKSAGATRVDVVIGPISMTGVPKGSAKESRIISNLKLKVKTEPIYNIDVRGVDGQLVTPFALTPIISLTGRYAKIKWQSKAEFPNYEVQILKLINTNEGDKTNVDEINTTVDWTTALSVETQSPLNTLELAISEGTGFYAYRVRPIGTYFKGGIANSQNYGMWSASPADGASVTLSKTNVTSTAGCFYMTDPDESINWIYDRVFTEGDQNKKGVKVHEGMTYADPLLNVRQNQSRVNEDGTSGVKVVTQSLTDYSGRPAFSTLPVPVPGNNGQLNGYVPGLVKDNTNKVYTTSNFDSDAKYSDPDCVNNASSFQYYSDGSSDPNAPSSQGYPFSRAVYAADGTGRVIEQSTPGLAHALGRQSDGKGHTTRSIMCSVSDDELIRLFGNEAPKGSSVIKTITIDPNNDSTVTYTSKEGKVIATALYSFKDKQPTAVPFEIEDAISENTLTGKTLTSSKRFSFNKLTNIGLDYEFLDNKVTLCGSDIGESTSCNYKVQFLIYNINDKWLCRSVKKPIKNAQVTVPEKDNERLTEGVTFNKDGSHWDDVDWVTESLNGGNPDAITPVVEDVTPRKKLKMSLPAGEYLIIKRLYEGENIAEANISGNGEMIDLIKEALAAKFKATTDSKLYEKNVAKLLNDLSAQSKIFNDILSTTAEKNAAQVAILNLLEIDNTKTLPASFNLTYDDKGPDANKLTFTTSCCGGGNLSVPKAEECKVCSEIDKLLYDTDGTTPQTSLDITKIDAQIESGFIQPLISKLYSLGISDASGEGSGQNYFKVMQGFTIDKMRFMLSNMITSRYWTGASTEDGYRAKQDAKGGLVKIDIKGDLILDGDLTRSVPLKNGNVANSAGLPYNYKCENLYKCWISSVQMIGENEDNGDENTSDNVLDLFNDKNKEQDANSSSTAQKQGDDEDNRDAESKKNFFKKIGEDIVAWLISREMEDFASKDEGKMPSSKIQVLNSLPSVFIKCAGHQFAEIIELDKIPKTGDPQHEYNTGVDPTEITFAGLFGDISLGGVSVQSPLDYEVDNSKPESPVYSPKKYRKDILSVGKDKLLFPYMPRVEWMFKYFVYAPSKKDDADEHKWGRQYNDYIPTQLMVELNSCYKSIADDDGDLPLCGMPACGYYHESWDMNQRYNFYMQISGAPLFTENQPDKGPYNKLDQIDFSNNASKEFEELNSSCEAKRADIRLSLVKMFSEAGYTLVDCSNGASGEVTNKQIDELADIAVNKCINLVTDLRKEVQMIDGIDRGVWVDHTVPEFTAYQMNVGDDVIQTFDVPYSYSTNSCYWFDKVIDSEKNGDFNIFDASTWKINSTPPDYRKSMIGTEIRYKLFSDNVKKAIDMLYEADFIPFISSDGTEKVSSNGEKAEELKR